MNPNTSYKAIFYYLRAITNQSSWSYSCVSHGYRILGRNPKPSRTRTGKTGVATHGLVATIGQTLTVATMEFQVTTAVFVTLTLKSESAEARSFTITCR